MGVIIIVVAAVVVVVIISTIIIIINALFIVGSKSSIKANKNQVKKIFQTERGTQNPVKF